MSAEVAKVPKGTAYVFLVCYDGKESDETSYAVHYNDSNRCAMDYRRFEEYEDARTRALSIFEDLVVNMMDRTVLFRRFSIEIYDGQAIAYDD